MSPKVATKLSTEIENGAESSSDLLGTEELMQIAEQPMSTDSVAEITGAVALDFEPSASPADSSSAVEDQHNAIVAGCATDQASASGLEPADVDSEDVADPHGAERHSDPVSQTGSTVTAQELPATTAGLDPVSSGDQAASVSTPDSQLATPPSLPDPAGISARLRDLVVTVGQVEELSRRAREAAASDLELYNVIAASQRQFEDGLADARRIGQEAEDVYKHAFGREAKAVAQPAVAEAREVEQAFAELAGAWRQKAESFLSEHPDVESLLCEQRQHGEEARRRAIARGKAERFQQLVKATDGALRQGLLDDARDCLKMLASEFPNEADRLKPLHDRLQHRVRAINDVAARRTLVEASELQGRGDFNGAVRLLEAVDVQGLSPEASEDVFGRWSAACSVLAQTGDLELLRYSPSQGRGIILHRDPSVPYGLVEFSALVIPPISRAAW